MHKILTFLLILYLFLNLAYLQTPVYAECGSSCPVTDTEVCARPSCPEGDASTLPPVRVNPAPVVVTEPAPAQNTPTNTTPAGPALPPAVRRPVIPYNPPRPIITCQHEGNYYYPGQKRYECFSPREQGACSPDAGYGIPYICDGSGNWGAGNNGLAECSNACPVETSTETYSNQSCPNIDTDTCIYRISSSNSDMCYSGTGAYGFTPDCKYSCGPVVCPVIPDSQASTSQENSCSGELSFTCSDNLSINASWNITNKLGGNSCNVFIRDEFGDHTISNDCNSSWSGSQIPNGALAVEGGTYELYISNGTDICFNKFASSTQISCRREGITEGENPPFNLGFIEPIVDWLSDSF